MSRIITKEDTKILIRALNKEVPMSGVKEINKKDLFYGGKKRFRWYPRNWKGVPYGMVNLGIPMKIAYREGDKGYVRKNLGDLDNYLYNLINFSEAGKLKKAVSKFEDDILIRVNRHLKVITMFTIEDGKDTYIAAVYDYESASSVPENVNYTDLRGDELGVLLEKYLIDKKFEVKGLKNVSQSNYMELRVGIENINSWNNFVNGVVGFDKEINK